MSEKKSYKVSIFGETYSLLSDESDAYVTQAAQLIDSYMKEVAGKLSPQTHTAQAKKCAVLAALRVAIILLKEKGRKEQRKQVEQNLVAWIDQELLSVS